jgi:hypothetical protein
MTTPDDTAMPPDTEDQPRTWNDLAGTQWAEVRGAYDDDDDQEDPACPATPHG